MNVSIGCKEKIITIKDLDIKIRSLTLDELGIVFEEIKQNGSISGAKIALQYGIVSPAILRDNPGQINAEIAVLLSAEIMKLTGIAHQPPFNPSKR